MAYMTNAGLSSEGIRPLTLRDRPDSHRDSRQRAGRTPPLDYIYEPNLRTDTGPSPYRHRSISPSTNADDGRYDYFVSSADISDIFGFFCLWFRTRRFPLCSKLPPSCLSFPEKPFYRQNGAEAVVFNSLCYATSVLRPVPSLYYNLPVPQHGFLATAAIMKTPSPDYQLVSEAPVMPTLQPTEIVRQSTIAVKAQEGVKEDGLSATMHMEVTPPAYVVQHHKHLPSFSGEMSVGR